MGVNILGVQLGDMNGRRVQKFQGKFSVYKKNDRVNGNENYTVLG